MTGFLKHGLSTSEKDRAVEMAKPLTPLSERPRDSYGSLLMSAQTTPGLCARGRKCVRKAAHEGACWPKED